MSTPEDSRPEPPDDLELPDLDELIGAPDEPFVEDDDTVVLPPRAEAEAVARAGEIETEHAGDEEETLVGPPDGLPEPALPAMPQAPPIAPPDATADRPTTAGPSPAPRPRTAVAPRRAVRYRLTSLVAGALLIALGVIFVWPIFSGGFILVPTVILAILIAGVALSLLAYWLNTGRRARGALFLALAGLFVSGLTGVFIAESSLDAGRYWPVYGVLLGGAILLTALGDRARDRRLIAPGAVLVIAGIAALLVTLEQIPAPTAAILRQIGPWVLLVLALGLLPLAFRRVPREE